jgi:hypothetical protein
MSKYQHPAPCEAERRIVNRTGRDAAPALPGPVQSPNSLPPKSLSPKSMDPRARDLQRSLGNQGVLRLLRSQADAASSGVSIRGAPQPQEDKPAGGTAQQQPAQTQPGQAGQSPTQNPVQNPAPAAKQNMPYTAVFNIAQHSSKAHQACGLPDTPNCVVSMAKWRLIDSTGAAVMSKVDLSETFKKESGPDDVFKKLDAQKNSVVTSDKGAFDDCYGLCVPDGTPPFSLQVLQNYLVDGQIAAQNHITYSPTGVMLRVCQREANGTFGDRCRRY